MVSMPSLTLAEPPRVLGAWPFCLVSHVLIASAGCCQGDRHDQGFHSSGLPALGATLSPCTLLALLRYHLGAKS